MNNLAVSASSYWHLILTLRDQNPSKNLHCQGVCSCHSSKIQPGISLIPFSSAALDQVLSLWELVWVSQLCVCTLLTPTCYCQWKINSRKHWITSTISCPRRLSLLPWTVSSRHSSEELIIRCLVYLKTAFPPEINALISGIIKNN